MKDIRPELKSIVKRQEARLREKNTDPSKADDAWKDMSIINLVSRLIYQAQLLHNAVMMTQDRDLVRKKAADVANFCMMVHDTAENDGSFI